MIPEVKLYGAERCHKTQYYKAFLAKKGLDYSFLDVEENANFAEELSCLYENRKLNFNEASSRIIVGKVGFGHWYNVCICLDYNGHQRVDREEINFEWNLSVHHKEVPLLREK